jgi:serine/threonine protein kinase/Tol biopolymer transport system component
MIGQVISHYKILEKLGEGGMGVVYKAQDTKLDRLVALKFLPPHLSASEQDKARFIQEAKAASAMNHPNICTIYSIDEHESQLFIAMEFVEGQTLGAKLKTQIPNLKSAIDMGVQVAEGLAAAHEKGIVHRDIKPENIMVRKDGIVQIMDFGLAKLKGVSRLTKEGSTVGTAGYMSPEQVQGQDADHRSDIFSLGVVLYELFTGQLPFKGVHETAMMYEIVNVDAAPMSALKPDIDPDLDRIVLECMEKDPNERMQSAKQVAIDLKRARRESGRQRVSRVMAPPQFAQQELPAERSQSPLKRFAWPAISALLASALVLYVIVSREGESAAPVMQFAVGLPDGAVIAYGYGFSALATSPNGKHFAYVSSSGGRPELFLRPMDQLTPQPMNGTEFAGDPFFSPDGQWVAFFSRGKLKKVSIFGGAAQEICDVPGVLRGGFWAPDNMIYFGHINQGIQRVPANGGTPEEVIPLDPKEGDISHRFPQLLPDGKTLIFTVKNGSISSFDDAIVAAQQIGSSERKTLLRGGTYARFAPTGHLIYCREGNIFAAPFDVNKLEVTGPPTALLEGGMLTQGSGAASFDFSTTGVLVYIPGGPAPVGRTRVRWIDRRGTVHDLLDAPGAYFEGTISPDGQKIALTISAANDDVWTYQILRRTMTRLTFGAGNKSAPIWSPDGRYVVYSSEKGKGLNMFRKAWDGSGKEEQLTAGDGIPETWTSDGKRLIYSAAGDLMILDMESKDRTATPLIQTPFDESQAAMSPDNRYLAYVSDESGRSEVYVVPFPGAGAKWQVSTSGGLRPLWARNGRELFFVAGDSLMVVDVTTQPSFNASVPRRLITLPAGFTGLIDLAPDGQRFMIGATDANEFRSTQVNVVVGWFDKLHERFATRK